MVESITIFSDLKFYYDHKTVEDIGPADIKVTGSALHTDPGLENSVLISLFSEGRADDQDLNDESIGYSEERSGWFGTALDPQIVLSKSWLLYRSVINDVNLRRHEQYDKDALQWMIDDGIFANVEVLAVRSGLYQINKQVSMYRRENDSIKLKYFINWENQLTIGGL